MKALLIYTAMIIITCACGRSQQAGEETTTDTLPAADTLVLPPVPDTPSNEQTGSEIRLQFEKDSTTLTAHGHMDSVNQTIIAYLDIGPGKKLTAAVIPADGKGNIRFNQIYFPDGNADGPFGKTMEYKLTQQGIYKLYIGANRMAEDAYTGKFTLTIKVE